VSGREFLAALPDGLPDCLILDLQMPEMTGLELQQHLNSKGIQIPTIVITGLRDTGVRERCASAGAIAFLPKPVEATSLLAAIDNARSITRDSR
jgi:FixJ family two-component response regulator